MMPDTPETAPITLKDFDYDPVALATERVSRRFCAMANDLEDIVPAGSLFEDCLRCLLAARQKAHAAITEAARQDAGLPDGWVI